MTVICYTFTTSDSPCFIIGFPSSQGKHRTSGCMFSSGGLQTCFYFPKLPSETGGETW